MVLDSSVDSVASTQEVLHEGGAKAAGGIHYANGL